MKKTLIFLASSFLANNCLGQMGNPAPYCVSQFDNNYNMVKSVTVNTTNFNVGSVGSYAAQNSYTFFNNAVFPSLSLNGTSTVAISFYSTYDWEPRYFGVWIDYNNNTIFDANELIMNNANTTFTNLPSGNSGGAAVTASMVITVPATAVPGVTRMRLVRSQDPVGSPFAPYSSTVQAIACNPIAANSAYGCTYDFSLSILSDAPVADFAVTPTVICAGDIILLTDLSTNAPNTLTWSTVGASSPSSTSHFPLLTYDTPGVYTIGLTASNNAGTSTLTKTITVYAKPQISASPANISVCANENATITMNGASTYSWNTGSTATVLVVSPSVTTVYTVVGTATSGCSATLSKTVVVVSCVGLNELTNRLREKILVFPNPANTMINITIDNFYEDIGIISIYNALGELMFQTKGNAVFQLDVSHYAKGIYYVERFKNGVQTRNIKFILQ